MRTAFFLLKERTYMNKIFLLFILIFNFNFIVYADSKYVLVTASTGSLGSEICKSLATENYNLIITGRNEAKLSKLKDELNALNNKNIIKTQIIDFSNVNTIETASSKIKDYSLSAIILISTRPYINKETFPPIKQWQQLFNHGFIMPLETLKVLSNKLANDSSIVVMSGLSSKYLLPGHSNTNILRISWNAEIKNLTKYFGKRKIRVNAISPGIIMTNYHKNRIALKQKKTI